MTWTAHYFDPRLNRDAVTRSFGSKDDALREARDLMHRKYIVHFIRGGPTAAQHLDRSRRPASENFGDDPLNEARKSGQGGGALRPAR
jgi:hypothetical protein